MYSFFVPLTIAKSYVVALHTDFCPPDHCEKLCSGTTELCFFSLSVSGAKLAKLAMPAVPTSSIAVSRFGAISFAQLVQ